MHHKARRRPFAVAPERLETKSLLSTLVALIDTGIDLARVAAAKDFFDFDNAATALLHGFRDAHDYYERSSSGRYLHGIRRPVLAIHAKDDPFMVPEVVPPAGALPPGVTIELCEHGGHVGFAAAGPRYGVRWWLEERIPEFLMGHVGVAA